MGRKSSVGEGIVHRSSQVAAAIGGDSKVQNQQMHSKFVVGSIDTSLSNSDKHLDWNCTDIGGSSIKQLLSYEMLTESKQKRRPPSIIARLMGFEGLSPLEHTTRSSNQVKSQHANDENCSQTRPSKQLQQFKDVYEVSESTKAENRMYQSRRIATSDISEAEMVFLRQRLFDANCLSSDETFEGSEEFNDALEVLQSNKDIFLKLLQEQESMLAKRPHDLRRSDRSTERCRYAKESIRNQNYRNIDMNIKFQEDSLRNVDCGTSQKHSKYHGSSKSWLEGYDNMYTHLTNIVVLKPNFRRVPISEPDSDALSCVSEYEHSKKVQKLKVKNAERRAKKYFSDGLQLPKQYTRESRELAKKITQKMRCSLHSNSLDFSVYRSLYNNNDYSSSHESENDSSYDSDYLSFKSYNTRRNKGVQSHDTGSSLSKEAGRRLSERWKMTQQFQEVGLSKRSTLGEMLSSPRCRKESNIVILAGKGSTKGCRLNSSEEQAWPIGISSRDGWKYGLAKSSSRSISVTLPATCNSLGVCESVSPTRRKLSNDDKHPIEGMLHNEPRKLVKEMPLRNKGLYEKSSKSKSERLYSNKAHENFSGDYCVPSVSDTPVHDETPREKEIFAPETSLDAGSIMNEIENAQSCTTPISLTQRENYVRSVSYSDVHSSLHYPSILNLQNLSDKKCKDSATPPNVLSVSPESPSISKDAEKPSPVSVLGVPFLDDISNGTECFGSLTADLKGLRMQLQLLKQESEIYAKGSIAISSSEDDDEDSVGVSERRLSMTMNSLDSSYIIDVLTNIGFYDTDADTFMSKWHSRDHPMNPAEFEKLEEKNGEQAIWSRAERLILYDLISAGLVETFKPFSDPHPWVKQSSCLSDLSDDRDINSVEEKLLNWLQVQLTQETKGNAEEILACKELEWYDSAQYIDQVGSKVEEQLTDDLIAEIFDIL